MEVEMNNLQVPNIKQYIQHQEHQKAIVIIFYQQVTLSKKVMQYLKHQQVIQVLLHGIMAQEIKCFLTSLTLVILFFYVETISIILEQVCLLSITMQVFLT